MSASFAPGTVHIAERPIIVLHLRAPESAIASHREAAMRVVERLSRATIRSPEEVGIDGGVLDRCEGSRRSTCWLEACSRIGTPIAGIMALTIHRDAGAAMIFLHVPRAEAERRSMRINPRDPDAGEVLENLLFDRASKSAVVPVAGELEALYERLVRNELAGLVEVAPNGSVRITGARPGLAIRIDGVEVARTAEGDTVVEGILEGSRTVALADGERVERSGAIIVRAGEVTELGPPPVEAPESAMRQVGIWGGIGLAGVGSAIAIWAAAAGGGRAIVSCTAPGCGGPVRSFETFPELAGREGGGPLAAPFGYSLAIAGGAWAIGSWFADRRFEWLPVIVALGLGAISYGLSAALD